MTNIAQTWLVQAFVLFLMAGCIAGLAVGITLLLSPERLRALSALMNRWISTRQLDQPLERNVRLDPWFYRHSTLSGALTLLGACYILYFFAVSMDRAATAHGLARYFGQSTYLVEGLLDALVLTAMVGALSAVFVSLFFLIRPSMLREIEQGANRWLSLRRALKPMEVPRQGMDEYVFRHARQTGILLVVGSLYGFVLLLLWFGH